MQIYRRIALFGAIANPNVGDEAILNANLQMIYRMYGDNCKVYVFSKNAAFSAQYSAYKNMQIICVDYLHKISENNFFDIRKIKEYGEKVLSYPENHDSSDELLLTSLHDVFKEIDILHIVGGGYLNSLWPDIVYEAEIAVNLARLYGKKYLVTGISTYPINDEICPVIQDILRGAELVDYRDQTRLEGITAQSTIDDATFLEDIYSDNKNEKYANILFHVWKNSEELSVKKINAVVVPFMEECIEKGDIDYINLLAFSEEDTKFWNQTAFSSYKNNEKIRFVKLWTCNSSYCKHIVSNAKFNMGSRFHLAVFSLSSCVPILSVYYDEYYKNKICSLHNEYKSEEVVSIDNLSKEILDAFIHKIDLLKKNLCLNHCQIQEKNLEKNKAIAHVYAIDENDEKYIFERLCKTNKNIKISVIVPIYNMDAYLQECLKSVCNQTLKDIEIICVNDGSTDYSQDILNEFSWKDNRIKVITQTNHGVAYARNRAISISKGEFLFFLDPDDWLPDENVFSDMYKAAKSNNVLICGGNFREHSCNGVVDQWHGNLCKYQFEKNQLMTYEEYQFDYGWVRFIYNRDFIVYNNFKIPPYKFFEDPVFFVKVMDAAQVFYAMNRCTYCYRTGYKSPDFTYEKVVDLVNGLYENMLLAYKRGYNNLLSLEVARIESDYAEAITKHLINSSSIELRDAIEKINKLIFDDNNRIEYRIYNKILGNKNAIIYNLKEESRQKINEMEMKREQEINSFYNSTTWKVGDLILWIPKKIKIMLRG